LDSKEIAELIKELEDRVERLRALYDQYFMGIERLEPLTLRKDLDRRLWPKEKSTMSASLWPSLWPRIAIGRKTRWMKSWSSMKRYP